MAEIECHAAEIECHMTKIECHVAEIKCHMTEIECYMTEIECYMAEIECHVTEIECYMAKIECYTFDPTVTNNRRRKGGRGQFVNDTTIIRNFQDVLRLFQPHVPPETLQHQYFLLCCKQKAVLPYERLQ